MSETRKQVDFWKKVLKDDATKDLPEKIIAEFTHPRQIQALVKFTRVEDWNDGMGDSVYVCDDVFVLQTPDEEDIVVPYNKDLRRLFGFAKPRDEFQQEIAEESGAKRRKLYWEFAEAYDLAPKANYDFSGNVFSGGGWHINLEKPNTETYTWKQEYTLPDDHFTRGKHDIFIQDISYKFLLRAEDLREALVPKESNYWTDVELKVLVNAMQNDLEKAKAELAEKTKNTL